jgi:hypothetical protein
VVCCQCACAFYGEMARYGLGPATGQLRAIIIARALAGTRSAANRRAPIALCSATYRVQGGEGDGTEPNGPKFCGDALVHRYP